jgi:FkbM family methyltransferase
VTRFVTHAQNFEDVMLWRALRHLGTGFYIDAGAADPTEFSVTRAFYERGWSGVNIEPDPDFQAALRRERPRDVNLDCLLGARRGEAVLHRIPGTGLSTLDAGFAARHASSGFPVETLRRPVRPLVEICRDHAPGPIHFLKIDVEGAEADVLRGCDFATFRPWIILLEATEPNSQVPSWQGWEPLLTRVRYRFAWFDGLNRFYLAMEHEAALRPAFASPPNVFDNWVSADQVAAEQRALRAEAMHLDGPAGDAARVAVAQANAALEARLAELQAAHDQLVQEGHRAREETAAAWQATLAAQQQATAAHELAEGARRVAEALQARQGELEAALEAARQEAAASLQQAEAAHQAAAEAQRQAEAARQRAETAEAEAGHSRDRAEAADARAEAAEAQAGTARRRAEAAERTALDATRYAEQATRRAEAAELQARRAEAARDAALAAIDSLQASTSWRLTAPLRRARGLLPRSQR